MTTFDRIKQISKKRGLSLKTVNDMAGLGTNAVYKWKTQKPNYEALSKVADVLGVSVDYLLGNTHETTKSTSTDTDDLKEYFEQHQIMRYDGKPIPESDLEVIKRILESN